MNSVAFSYTEPIMFGWGRLKKYWKLMVTYLAVTFIFSSVSDGLVNVSNDWSVRLLIQVLLIPVSISLQLAGAYVALWIVDDKGGGVRGSFEAFRKLITPMRLVYFLLSSIIMGVAVMAGLVLLIVPGVILAIMFSMYAYAFVDGVYGVRAPLKRSRELTQGYKTRLFLFSLVLLGFNLLGIMALLVGVLVTGSVSMIAYAYVYRVLTGSVPKNNVDTGSVLPKSGNMEDSPEPMPVMSQPVSGMGMPRPTGEI